MAITTLGLEFLKYQETQRSNMAKEFETNRHNVEGERETYRHNSTTETLESDKLRETTRHNKASERNDLRKIAGTTGLIDAANIINPNMTESDKERLKWETTGSLYKPFSRTVGSVLGKATPTIGAGLLGATIGKKAAKAKPDFFAAMEKSLKADRRIEKVKSSIGHLGRTLGSAATKLSNVSIQPILVPKYLLDTATNRGSNNGPV